MVFFKPQELANIGLSINLDMSKWTCNSQLTKKRNQFLNFFIMQIWTNVMNVVYLLYCLGILLFPMDFHTALILN